MCWFYADLFFGLFVGFMLRRFVGIFVCFMLRGCLFGFSVGFKMICCLVVLLVSCRVFGFSVGFMLR